MGEAIVGSGMPCGHRWAQGHHMVVLSEPDRVVIMRRAQKNFTTKERPRWNISNEQSRHLLEAEVILKLFGKNSTAED